MNQEAYTAAYTAGIANPGQCARLKVYPNPNGSGEIIRGYRRVAHSLVYYSAEEDRIVLYTPPGDALKQPEYDLLWMHEAPIDLVLVTRKVRRARWMSERRAIKKRVKEIRRAA